MIQGMIVEPDVLTIITLFDKFVFFAADIVIEDVICFPSLVNEARSHKLATMIAKQIGAPLNVIQLSIDWKSKKFLGASISYVQD